MNTAAALAVLVGLAFTGGCSAESPLQDTPAARPIPGPAATPWLIACSRLDNADETRLLLGLGADGRSVTRFEIVTPDFLWRIPGQPETRRFSAGQSDASPDLAGALRFAALADADGELRMLDFTAPAPDAVQLEGLRGSLALHESWQNDRALGSLFHAATGNLTDVSPVQCRRFEQTRTGANP
ncbi:hypothetical protein [Thauera sp.]|jgi:hypothetical protein|uniref:hypothetical protein n=1 Tax=Thauera sp. TaxID=1905334 RepID=UPI002A35CA73|nr:hypothetical protein [Thauera sp.]MDX9886795.1 hypothetical protein [Thauera sp.]